MFDLPLTRRAAAEAVGAAAVVLAVVGSGIAAERLSADPGLRLLENTLATVFALVAILSTIGPVSGAHLNPVVSAVEVVGGRLPRRDGLAYVAAQVGGAVVGAFTANALFGRPVPETSSTVREGAALLASEGVATAGLVLVVRLAAARAASPALVPFLVAAWVGGAYWFTPSTAFGNPAVTIGRACSDSFAGIAPRSVPGFVLAQIVGGAAGAALARFLAPAAPSRPPAERAP